MLLTGPLVLAMIFLLSVISWLNLQSYIPQIEIGPKTNLEPDNDEPHSSLVQSLAQGNRSNSDNTGVGEEEARHQPFTLLKPNVSGDRVPQSMPLHTNPQSKETKKKKKPRPKSTTATTVNVSRAKDGSSAVDDIFDSKVVWFGQGPAAEAEMWKKRFEGLLNAEIFYHSYDEPCDICIYKPGTNFAEGRNLALYKAFKMIDPIHVKYYVSFDSDLIMVNCTESDDDLSHGIDLGDEDRCWRGFHKMLSRKETQHAMITPKTWWDPSDETERNFQTCAENAVNAFRGVNMVRMIYPLSYVNIDKDWTYNTHVGWHLIDRCFPDGFLSDERFVLSNPSHATYPMEHNPDHVFEILNEDFGDIGPWEPPLLWHRCSVWSSPIPSEIINETMARCTPLFEKRFQAWLYPLPAS